MAEVSRTIGSRGRPRRRASQPSRDLRRDRVRVALEAANIGTWEVDLIAGRADWSPPAEALRGLAEGSFGGTIAEIEATIHPDDRERVRAEVAVSRTGVNARIEYRVIWPDGSVHWLVDVGRHFFDSAGRPVRAAGISMDVTAERRLEEQLRQAQKMEVIGNLAGGIAHDFNNLLTAILGYSNVLLEEESRSLSPAVIRSFHEEIRKAGERAAALTNQLLAFSRRQIIQPGILDLNTVVGGLEPMLRRLIGEDVELATRLTTGLGTTRADRGQIEQIVMNLVVNGRDAMPTGGRIVIETANVTCTAADPRPHGNLVPGEYVMLSVRDTGTGMSPEVQARMFEPFFTTKAAGRGTGLGLATIYGIVQQNHGGIVVESVVGEGTAVAVYLPRDVETAAEARQRVTATPRGRGERVLLVEDDHRVRKLARELLIRCGYDVIEGADAEDAIRVAAADRGAIHLLLTDVVMPGASGPILAERLRSSQPQIKVLYMSGYTDDAIVHHGVVLPDIAFLQKPFTPASFARAIRAALDRP